jgi:heptosyltransferase-1
LTANSESNPNIDHILIVRLGAMGDVIHTLPAAQVLREVFPNVAIDWLIEERWAELLCAPGTPRRGSRSAQRPLVDWVHAVDLRAWRKSLFTVSTLQHISKAWNDVRSVRYDVAVDLQGAIRSSVLAKFSGARIVWGSSEPRESPATVFYTRQTIARGSHVIEQNLSLVEAVAGRKINPPSAKLPRDAMVEERISRELAKQRIHKYAVLNPGAGWGAKRWPAERYGEVARELSSDGLCPIINYGPGEEALSEEVMRASGDTAKPMKLSISDLIALMRGAELFIGGDTGPMHLAAALRVPVVAIFGPTNPARNGPYGTRNIVLRNPASPTTHARRSQPDDGMLEISIDAVAEAARRLLTSAAEGSHA